MTIPLEDTYADVVAKAMRGHAMNPMHLAQRAGMTHARIETFLQGQFDADVARKVACLLALDPGKLVALGEGSYVPQPVRPVAGLKMFTSPFGEMTVNSYLLWDPVSLDAALIDTGSDCDPALDAIQSLGLHPKAIFLTHAHGDHIIELDRLLEKTNSVAWISEMEPVEGVATFRAGKNFPIGALEVGSLPTPGHSPGGITYTVAGLEMPVAFVGDALFAGSMGGPNTSYADSLSGLRSQILTRPAETILCPGHGPLTTVEEQLRSNPFA